MFDLPNAKRVRRNEINSRSPSKEPSDLDPVLEARVHEQLGKIYRNVTEGELSRTAEPQAEAALISDNNAPEADEEGYEFRLFSAPSAKPSDLKSPYIPQRIVLRSPTPANGDPGFLNPRRSDQYYFTGTSTTEQMSQYSTTAVTGEEILQGLNIRWRGSELPWRVTVMKSTHQKIPREAPASTNTITGKRKKVGKKRRIAIRKKVAARVAKESARELSRAEKEVAEKDKRTRRNREKKVKRKGKEKAKKALAVVEDS